MISLLHYGNWKDKRKYFYPEISIVSSIVMVVKSGSKCKLPKYDAGSCSEFSSGKWNESLTLHWFLFNGFTIGIKNLARLYVGVYRKELA